MITSQIRSCSCQDYDNIGLTTDGYDNLNLECWIFDTASPGYNADPSTYINPDEPNIRKIGVITIELHETTITTTY